MNTQTNAQTQNTVASVTINLRTLEGTTQREVPAGTLWRDLPALLFGANSVESMSLVINNRPLSADNRDQEVKAEDGALNVFGVPSRSNGDGDGTLTISLVLAGSDQRQEVNVEHGMSREEALAFFTSQFNVAETRLLYVSNSASVAADSQPVRQGDFVVAAPKRDNG